MITLCLSYLIIKSPQKTHSEAIRSSNSAWACMILVIFIIIVIIIIMGSQLNQIPAQLCLEEQSCCPNYPPLPGFEFNLNEI